LFNEATLPLTGRSQFAIIPFVCGQTLEMRTQAEWEEHYQLMKAAKALADFARLESEDDVEQFQDDHSDFVPANWWVKSNWIRERNLLRKAWMAAFPADLALKLTTSYLFGEAHLLASAGIPAEASNPIAVQMVRDTLDYFEGRALVADFRDGT